MVQVGLAILFTISTFSFAASQASPHSMACYEPFSSFAPNPGVIGTSCRAANIGDADRALAYYKPFIFDFEKYLRAIEPAYYNRIYIDNILDLLEQVATDFYRERAALENRKVSHAELEGWVNAVLAVAYQESLMTHYQFDLRPEKKTVGKVQVLVGDAICKVKWQIKDGKYFCPEFKTNLEGKRLYGSLGMYQILLSIHASGSKTGFFDPVHNAQYAMSFAYSIWSKVIKGTHAGLAACKDKIFSGHKINYANAARSMYSVYNGGGAKVCRWTQDTIWKQNDLGYKFSIEQKPWRKYASSSAAREKRKVAVKLPDGSIEKRYEFAFDLKCVRDGRDLCLKKPTPNGMSKIPGVLTLVEDIESGFEHYCTWSAEAQRFLCVDNETSAACLQQAQPNWNLLFEANRFQIASVNAHDVIEEMASAQFIEQNSAQLCSALTDKIQKVGSEIWWPMGEALYAGAEASTGLQDLFYYDLAAKILGVNVRPGREEVWYRLEYYKNGVRREAWGAVHEAR